MPIYLVVVEEAFFEPSSALVCVEPSVEPDYLLGDAPSLTLLDLHLSVEDELGAHEYGAKDGAQILIEFDAQRVDKNQ